MKTVLITGAYGMLGRELARTLADHYRIVEHDLDKGDLRDFKATREFVREAAPNLVVHCAAMTNVDGCETDRDLAFAVNGLAVKNVAIAAKEVDAPVVHVSTDFVFDGEKGEPYLEYDSTHPISVYGESKLWGETVLRDHTDQFYIVRTQWLYGADGKNFVDTILGRAREGQPLTIVDDQRGCPTSTRELSGAIRKIFEEGTFGIYHASGNGSCTWFEFAKEMIRIDGIDADVSPMSSEELDRPARRPADSRLRNYHLELTIGDPMLPWEEALREYIEAKKGT